MEIYRQCGGKLDAFVSGAGILLNLLRLSNSLTVLLSHFLARSFPTNSSLPTNSSFPIFFISDYPFRILITFESPDMTH